MRYQRRLFELILAVAFSGVLFSQEFRATISGRVQDASGAAVPAASITVRGVETNSTNESKADSDGTFAVPFLRPGTYSLTVEAAGFKKYVQNGITLEVAQKAGFDIKLEVGAQTQSIEVVASTALLETESASRSSDLNTAQVQELPLNFRNPYSLVSNMPGVQFRGNLSWIRPFDGSTSTSWSMNGGIVGYNEILIDGAPNTTIGDGGGSSVGYVPTVDSVGEIKVQTSTYDAQYGRTSGGVANVGIKSGTNLVHGAAYEFYKRNWLDANTYSNNAVGKPKALHYLDQYGGQIDGPIYIPKLYNGKNRTFFNVSYERYREGTPVAILQSTVAPEFLTGDFSKFTTAGGTLIKVFDPLTGRADATAPGKWVRDQFPNNQIPVSRISKVSQNVANYFPKANCTTPGSGYSFNNYCDTANSDSDRYSNLLIKVDHNINQSNHVFFRYSGYNRDEDRPINGIVGPGENGQQPFSRITNSAVADWVATISPTLIANVRGSYTRFIERSFGAANVGFDIAGKLGFPASFIGTLPSAKDFGVYSVASYMTLGRGKTFNVDNDYDLNFSLTKIWNNHTIHAGFDLRQFNYLIENTGSIFNITANTGFTQQYTTQSNDSSGNASGSSMASFLLGYPGGGAVNIPVFPWLKQLYAATYVQDDWKVSQRLTLNLGLRWDVNLPVTEKHDRLNVGFDTTSASPLASIVNPSQFPYSNSALKGGIIFPNINGSSKGTYDPDYKTLAPRLGAAYKLSDKLVIRGGYGIYFFNMNVFNYRNYNGFAQGTTLNSTADGGNTPLNLSNGGLMANPFPNGYTQPTGSSAGLNTFVGQSITVPARNIRNPRTDQFSLGLQFSVSKASVLEVTYGASRGYRLQMSGQPLNLPSLANRKLCNVLEGGSYDFCNQQIANPFQGLAPFQVSGSTNYTNTTQQRWQLMRPFPQFNADIAPAGDTLGRTWYNSMQINYKFRSRSGITLLTNYTLSKWTQRLNYNDPYVGTYQQGIAQADQTHVFKFVAVYQLPFGKGKKFMPGAGGFANRVIGGWEANTSYTIHSGEPVGMPGNAIWLKPGKIPVNWDQYQARVWNPCALQMNNDGSITIPSYAKATCGSDPSTYSWLALPQITNGVNQINPNSQYNGQIRMSRQTVMDASLNKSIPITERVRGQFRLEAFNVLNHAIFGTNGINTNVTDSNMNFGSFFPASGVASFPRQIQLGFKLLW